MELYECVGFADQALSAPEIAQDVLLEEMLDELMQLRVNELRLR
jgi:hypothetical protein